MQSLWDLVDTIDAHEKGQEHQRRPSSFFFEARIRWWSKKTLRSDGAEKTKTHQKNLLPSQKKTARSAVSTDKAPGAVGPYSQAIKTTGAPLLFVSGQVALVPGTKELAAGGVEAQAEQCLKNLGAILEAGGASLGSVVKTTVLLADMGDFAAVNGVYARYFSEDPQPARACFAVKALPLGALVEIEATAVASG